MTDKEKKNQIVDILLDFYEEYDANDRPMIPNIYAGKILDSLQEEPVSEDWYEAAVEHAATGEILPNCKEMINFDKVKAFKAGAQWQKQKDAKILESVITNGKDYPTLDSFLNTFKIMQYGKIKM